MMINGQVTARLEKAMDRLEELGGGAAAPSPEARSGGSGSAAPQPSAATGGTHACLMFSRAM
jgi:hypothetical protein